MAADERIYIKDFGPIREADIAVRDLTIFVGPQAAGKSLAAQTLYFMRGMEELLLPGSYAAGNTLKTSLSKTPTGVERLNNAFTFWLGTSAPQLGHRDTILRWQAASGKAAYELRYSFAPEGEPQTRSLMNESLESRIERPADVGAGDAAETQVYIPAGRVLYSYISPSQALYLLTRTKIEWPGYVNLFYEKLSGAIRLLFEHWQAHGFAPGERSALREKQEAILRGRLLHGDPDRISISIEDAIAKAEGYARSLGFDPLRLASGQMEMWPFFSVVEAALLSPSAAATRIFFEEPEAHLHPAAQRQVIQAISWLTRQRLRFVLTTHSPYIVYAINNLLLAGKVLAGRGALPASVPPDAVLSPEQVSAYRFTGEGRVESILDEETGLIKTDELDDPAAELNAEFSELQDSL